MNTDRAHDQLLDDVLNDEKLAALRFRLYERCRAELAGRRRSRVRRLLVPAAAAAALLVLLGVFDLVGRRGDRGPGDAGVRGAAGYVVTTAALWADELVSSPQAVGRSCLVRTQAGGDPAVHTARAAVMVETTYRADRIDDAELLAMFPGAPRALIGTRGGGRALVFLDPADSDRYFAAPE